MIPSSLASRSFCLTGGLGAIAYETMISLREHGASRIVLADLPQVVAAARGTGSFDKQKVELKPCDVRSTTSLCEAFEGVDTVIHLAGVKNAGAAQRDPEAAFDVNTQGTARVLEACRSAGVGHFVLASTAHVYGAPSRLPIDEDARVEPKSIYAASKAAAELVVQSYAAGFGLKARIARLGNVYGGALDEETIIGRAAKQAFAGGPIALRNLTPVRDFIHLTDVAEGLVRLAAATYEPARAIVNLSRGEGVSVAEIAGLLAELVGARSGRPVQVAPPQETSKEAVPELVLSVARLQSMTNWSPALGIRMGLARLVEAIGANAPRKASQ